MKALTKIERVSKKQIAFGRKIGLDLSNCTIGVAIAKIEDLIDQNFWGKELGRPTDKQIEVASRFGYDISGETERIGFAIIGDILHQLNLESIQEQNLKPGDVVKNKWDSLHQQFIISSIQEDGRVFFKAQGCKQAWARSLIKVNQTNS